MKTKLWEGVFNKDEYKLFQESNECLSLHLGAAKSLNGRTDGQSSRGGNSPSTSSNHLSTLLALPNTDARSLHGVLSAEGTSITSDYLNYFELAYVLCWVISIFFTILRREEPYLVPYFPQIPTFLVLLPYIPVISFDQQQQSSEYFRSLSQIDRIV